MKAGNHLSLLVLREPMLFVVLFAFAMWMVVVLPAYLYTDHREKQLDRNGVTTRGTVISAERACSDDECQSVTVTYTVDGEKHSLTANTDPNNPRADAGLKVGQRVEVRYDPANPDRARLLTLGESEAGFFRFMTFFGLILFGIPLAWLLVKRRIKPPEPLPEMSAYSAQPGGRAARHDAHRLPDGGAVLVPDPMLPLALVSGFGLLAMGLFFTLIAPITGSEPDLAGILALAALCPLFLAFVTFFASRSLVAGPGWLATKRGLRWQVIHAEDLVDAPPGNAIDALFGQAAMLRLYSSDTRIDINRQNLASPEVRSAVESFVEQAPGILPQARATVFGSMLRASAAEPDASYDPKAMLRKMWLLSGLLSAICMAETTLILVLRG